ncbi:MAG: nucleotidyltransferase domain-containing protein [Candidatus Methylomirabilales bacterium]
MSIDIREEIERITAQLVSKYAPERIILFGGAARGEFHPDSDADFLIIKQDCPMLGADRIRELYRLIDRRIPVDFLVYRPDEFNRRVAMGDPFLKAILREGTVLYGG